MSDIRSHRNYLENNPLQRDLYILKKYWDRLPVQFQEKNNGIYHKENGLKS